MRFVLRNVKGTTLCPVEGIRYERGRGIDYVWTPVWFTGRRNELAFWEGDSVGPA